MTLVGELGAFALGACLGSFANVLIDRLPRGLSPIRPRSYCEACGIAIRPVHLIPLVGYLLARGRCASCAQPIPMRLPLVEAAGGILAAASFAVFGFSWEFLSSTIVLLAALAAGVIDSQHHVIPNAITLPCLAAGLALSLLPGRPTPLEAVVGVAVAGGLLALIAMVYPKGMGGGDVKFMAMTGAFLGWAKALVALFTASLAGAVVGLALITLGRRSRKEPISFGPFLALGVATAVFAGPRITALYVGWAWALP